MNMNIGTVLQSVPVWGRSQDVGLRWGNPGFAPPSASGVPVTLFQLNLPATA